VNVRIAIALLAIVIASCAATPPRDAPPLASAAARSPADDPSGNYTLKTIDGNALPLRPLDRDRPAGAGPGPLVTGGSLVIEPGGEVRYVLDYRNDRGEGGAIRMSATWRREGNGFVVTWPNGARTPATYDGQTFTIENIGMKLAFERR
jgi:hypothetical protein